jgi:serine/threonine/tyrosine-interacting protein
MVDFRINNTVCLMSLGPYAAATRAKLGDMKAAGITHVVCVREYLERNLIRPNHPEHFKYLVVEVQGM